VLLLLFRKVLSPTLTTSQSRELLVLRMQRFA
jgi:hypothetical protein